MKIIVLLLLFFTSTKASALNCSNPYRNKPIDEIINAIEAKGRTIDLFKSIDTVPIAEAKKTYVQSFIFKNIYIHYKTKTIHLVKSTRWIDAGIQTIRARIKNKVSDQNYYGNNYLLFELSNEPAKFKGFRFEYSQGDCYFVSSDVNHIKEFKRIKGYD